MGSGHGYWFWESLLSKEACENIIKDYFDPDEAVYGGYEGQNLVSGKRDTKVCWAASNTHLGLLLSTNMLLANQKAGWLFDVDAFESIQIGEYGLGGHYDWHADDTIVSRNKQNTQRKLSVSLLLSDPDTYEGGDLLFDSSILLAGDKTPTRKQGSLIIFPSIIRHTVTPVTKGIRYSAVTWALGPNFK